jgi:hypothetical protein
MKNAAHKARRTHSDKHEAQIDWSRAHVVGRGTKTGRRYDLKTLRAALGPGGRLPAGGARGREALDACALRLCTRRQRRGGGCREWAALRLGSHVGRRRRQSYVSRRLTRRNRCLKRRPSRAINLASSCRA